MEQIKYTADQVWYMTSICRLKYA